MIACITQKEHEMNANVSDTIIDNIIQDCPDSESAEAFNLNFPAMRMVKKDNNTIYRAFYFFYFEYQFLNGSILPFISSI